LRAYFTAALLLLVIFGGIGAYLYSRYALMSGMDFSPGPVTITAATAETVRWDTSLAAIGTIRAVRGVELSSESSGEITAVKVKSGDRVKKGDLLITLNDSVEQASRENQIASLQLARLLYERDVKLVAQKSIPQSQFDRSRADLEQATAQLAETEARLDEKRIQAPFSGTIGIVHAKVGSYLNPGDNITTLQDLSELEIDFTVPAHYYPLLRPGQAIAVRVDAFPDTIFGARLRAIDTKVDPATGNLLLRAALEPGSNLLPGMFAQLEIYLGEERELVALPEAAVAYSLQGDTVYVLQEDDKGLSVTPRVVTTGPALDGRIAIISGLASGERVASSGQNKLFKGARVVVDETVALEGL
jgi:membrane fusion protein (multidrug efflux system)